METGFRKLDEREIDLLKALLEVEFPHLEEWRSQLASMSAKQINPDGTLILRCESGSPLRSDANPPLPTKGKLGVEGMYKDADGGDVAILLHADGNGFLEMLEIIKYGGAPIITPPSARDVVVLPPEDRGRQAGQVGV